MSIVGQEFWVVAVGCAKGDDGAAQKSDLLNQLKRQSALNGIAEPAKFDVPDGERSLLGGSMDTLMRLTDDLAKADGSVDSILHRIERQYLELEPKANFIVKSQRQEIQCMNYLRTWHWDEAKYPKSRSIADTLTWVTGTMNFIDEEVRNKTSQYNEIKTQKGNISKKEGANLPGKDLIDVLTPDVVKADGGADDDFISTEHLITVPVIVPRGCEDDFLKTYETAQENASVQQRVVPGSARKFKGLDDKDGNTLWRVVMFKGAADNFKKICRDKRFTVRDFEYSKDSYTELEGKRKQIDESVKRQRDVLLSLYQATWSDVCVAWMHIKAMRVFVESVLRFGMPPSFASFIVTPKGDGVAARKALADTLGKQAGSFSKMAEDKNDGDEDFFPYVSLTFTPFVASREKA